MKCLLTWRWDHEKKYENEKYLYVSIKKLNFIEKCAFHNVIGKDQRDSKISGFLDQITQLKSQIQNFNIDQFTKVSLLEVVSRRQHLCNTEN